MRVVFDTPILVDFLNGVDTARDVLYRADEAWISVVTWLELMASAESAEEQAALDELLDTFQVQPLTLEVSRRAVEISKTLEVGLAEAAIIATARSLGAELVTWNPNVVGGSSRTTEELKREVTKRSSRTPPPPEPRP